MPTINHKKLFNRDFVKNANAGKEGKDKQSYNQYIRDKIKAAPIDENGKKINPIDMTRVVMTNYMGPYSREDKKGNKTQFYLCEFQAALDQKDPKNLYKEDARLGLKSNFQRDANGDLITEKDENGQPKMTADGKPMYKNASLQQVDKAKFDNLFKNGIHTPRLTVDGKPVINKQGQAIDYVVCNCAIERVEQPVVRTFEADGKTVKQPVLDDAGKTRKDIYYAPVLDYIQTKDLTYDKAGNVIEATDIPKFDPQKHFENAKEASASTKSFYEKDKEGAALEAEAQAGMSAPTTDAPEFE